MEGSSSDPNHKSKGICASKDRVVTTSLHGILSVWNACHRDRAIVLSVELTLGDGMLRLYFSHIFIYLHSYEHQQQKRLQEAAPMGTIVQDLILWGSSITYTTQQTTSQAIILRGLDQGFRPASNKRENQIPSASEL